MDDGRKYSIILRKAFWVRPAGKGLGSLYGYLIKSNGIVRKISGISKAQNMSMVVRLISTHGHGVMGKMMLLVWLLGPILLSKALRCSMNEFGRQEGK